MITPKESYAYRFVPLDDDGAPRETTQYALIWDTPLVVGSRFSEAGLVDADAGWEVVEVRSSAADLVAVRDALGRDVPVAGTLICRRLN
ncbi:MAG: hypothetical protein ACYDCH_10555 [Gaiellaceae bacterium]